MIDLYTWATPNGRKVSILLEELELPYTVRPIDIENGAQRTPEFQEISPNGRIPAITDHDTDLTLMESGAIMIYLAEKYGRFLPSDLEGRNRVIEWLMWQMGGFGPMLGQAHHFIFYNPGKSPYAQARYAAEAQRLYGVLDRRLQDNEFVAGDYSIADMAIWPWAARYPRQDVKLEDFPNVQRWYRQLLSRDAVRTGYAVPFDDGALPEG